MHDDSIHTYMRELLALRLYGELDDAGRARLDDHLTHCAACRAFDVELERGLGQLASAVPERDLPSGWRERLERQVAQPALRTWRPSFGLGAVAGLAAGVLIAWGVVATGSGWGARAVRVASNAGPAAESAPVAGVGRGSDALPPKARGGGELERLTSYLRK
jgi:predicted anti-sigma-YlaC factor YlaD